MKKLIALTLAFVLAFALCACGGDDKKTENNNADPAAFTPVEGETYDTGKFSVTAPKGWMVVPTSDMFDDYEGDYDPTSVTLVKDGAEEWDSLDHAWIRINLYDKDGLIPTKDVYDDAKDLDPMTVSGFECTAFSCTSSDYPYIIIEGTNDKNDISFSILTKNDKSSVELSDNDVQTILRSVEVK